MELIAAITLALAATQLGVLSLMLAGIYWQVWLHVRHRERALAREAEVLALPLPEDLPHIAVQIPVFNEAGVVARAIDAAARLDWPRDRLHVQVLDDSTDETGDLARAAAAGHPGLPITILHRDDRADFKAGALKAGMAALPQCEFFAILDADYIPPPDFLRRTMKPLMSDQRLAFSQARIDYLNADQNTLTRIQSIILDAHFAIEQATRSWAGHPLPFNGTCGIWRRAAIEAAGGWRGDTLTEDLDLSYRAWLAGWRGAFLVTVTVPGELPATREAWTLQQRRWQTGSGEIARRMFKILFAARGMGPGPIAGALLQLATWWSTPLVYCTVPVAVLAGLLTPRAIPWLVAAGLALAAGSQIASLVSWRLANRMLRPGQLSASRFFQRCFSLQFNALGLLVRNASAYARVLTTGRKEFERTPKSGDVISSD